VLARSGIARNHGAASTARFQSRHLAMNGTSNDAAALCNSR
jgi:hypothetical protein